ncbi:MAG: DUF1592 domain-containing protein [Acidobacteriota bacterium]
MRRPLLGPQPVSIVATLALGLVAAAGFGAARGAASETQPTAATAPAGGVATVSALDFARENRTVRQYCVRCHRTKAPSGGLSLEGFDLAHAARDAETAEKVIRKLQSGMMPARPARRPAREELTHLADTLAEQVDRLAGDAQSSSGRTFQRLNHAEYENAVYDLLGFEVDAAAFLPADTVSAGFDNIADAQGLSSSVLEGYLNAAAEVSRRALGERRVAPQETKYTVSRYESQWEQVEGAPYGTRGGLSTWHVFPADGDYRFTMAFFDAPIAFLYGYTTYHQEQVELSIDGERVALLDLDHWMDADNENLPTEPIFVRGGRRRVTAAFLTKNEGPVTDLLSPFEWSLADRTIGAAYGITTLPHLRDLAIAGPYGETGLSSAPARRAVFTCRPTTPAETRPCARSIVEGLAAKAYRRPLEARDLDGLMTFFEQGFLAGGFEEGVRAALEGVLASPHFLFRLERQAPGAPGQVDDTALASRLSFYLWASAPDEELLELARSGRLADTEVFAGQVDRLLASPKSSALARRFAGQWLRLQDLDAVHPNSLLFPDYDDQLAAAMRRETELFFEHVLRSGAAADELLTAEYSFVNERLARHYGLRGVVGDRFRRVSLASTERRGLLGHGSVLTSTSHADRTSPVLRGKWIMGVLLGSPPPPPPPDVPDLEATEEVAHGRRLTVRERMEMHRANPACASCHDVIDPLGLALETYDVTGARRIKDQGLLVDATGEMYDGRELRGVEQLRGALLDYRPAFLTNLTVNLMSYGLGRRIEAPDMPEVRRIARRAAARGDRLDAYVREVALSPSFRANDRVQGASAPPSEETRRRR